MLASSYTVHSFVRYVGEYTITMDSESFRKAASRRMPSRWRSLLVWWMHVLSKKTGGPENPRPANVSLHVNSARRNSSGQNVEQTNPASPYSPKSRTGRNPEAVRAVSAHATRNVTTHACHQLKYIAKHMCLSRRGVDQL